MSEDIKGKIKKIVADHLGIDEEKVTEEASFIDDLGADSLDTVELVMAFEEEFGSEISDSEAEKILTVGDAIKFIESKKVIKIKLKFNGKRRSKYNGYFVFAFRCGKNNSYQKNSTKI